MANHILLTGIPGTGKTTIGDHLQQKFGFVHYDFENMNTLGLFSQDIPGFISNALVQPKVVISWGFMPYGHTEHVLHMKNKGFTLIWFDGNRDAAFREFMRRGDVSEQAYRIQLANIDSSHVIEQIQPIIFDTFDNKGQFKNLHTIALDIIQL